MMITSDKLNKTYFKDEQTAIYKILTAEVCQVALSEYPAVFLSNACEIIDVSEIFRSCCGDSASRTFLADSMNEDDYVSLTKLCKGKDDSIILLKLYYRAFRYAVVQGINLGTKRYAVLYLLENIKDSMLLKTYLSGRISEEHFRSFCGEKLCGDHPFVNSFNALSDPYSEMCEDDCATLLKNISAKLSRYNVAFPYKIEFSDTDNPFERKVRLCSGTLAMLFVAAINVLGPVSKNGTILVSLQSGEGAFYVDMETALPYDIKLRGETDKITTLAEHIPGSFPYLFVSELATVGADIRVLAKCEEKKISFSIVNRTITDTELRFNYQDMDAITEHTLYLVYAVLDYVKDSLDC